MDPPSPPDLSSDDDVSAPPPPAMDDSDMGAPPYPALDAKDDGGPPPPPGIGDNESDDMVQDVSPPTVEKKTLATSAPAAELDDSDDMVQDAPPSAPAPAKSSANARAAPAAAMPEFAPEPVVPVTKTEYIGYAPVCAADLPYEEDIPRVEARSDPDMLRDHAKSSVILMIFMAFFLLSFIMLVIWLGLIGSCKISGLCNQLDRSSDFNSDDYKFSTYPFLVPTVYIWAAMTAGTLGLFVLTIYAFDVLKKGCGTERMVEIATFIREGAVAFMSTEFQFLIILVIVLFILIGVGTNWRQAGAYILGSIMSALTGYVGMSMATRGNVRTAAAAEESISKGLNVAFRSGAVMGLSVVSIGLAGLSGVYLMMADVKSLAGFQAGASTIALFARVGGGIYTKAADVGADLVGKVEANIPEDDPRNPATIADNVGDNVGDVAGMGADLFESYSGSIIATAILGGTLPYFYRDSYALCVFNHLYIDELCGPYGYPSELSYAVTICSQNQFYLSYPLAPVWASNSIFIAVPFVLGLVGVLCSIICTIYVYVPKKIEEMETEETMSTLLWSLRTNVIISSILIIGGAAGICWGFFGESSIFQSTRGFGRERNLPYFALNTTLGVDACAVSITPGLLPQGSFELGHYRPIDTLGFHYPKPEEISWRLFVSIVIGLYLGMLIGYLTEYFTAGNYPPTFGIAESGEYGAGAVVIQGLGVGMLSTVLPLLLVMAVIVGSYNLFGTYTIALSAVGMLSTLGITMATDAYGPVADNAGGIAEMAELPSSVRDTTDALDALGNTTAATGKGFSNGSAVLTAYALLTALVQDSGLAPSPYQIAGTPTSLPTASYVGPNIVDLVDIYVVASILIGIMLPFLFGALTMLAVSRAAQAMIVEVRRQFREIDGLREGRPGVRPDHVKCIEISTRSSIIEMVLPGVVAIMSPLIIGFGFGIKAMIGLLLAAIGSGYMMGILMSNAGGAWDNAKKLTESGIFGKKNAKGSEWHKATVAGDTVGDPFKDTSGPSMNILIKLMTVFGLVAVVLMKPRLTDGWIGAILLGVTLTFAFLYAAWNFHRAEKTRKAAKEISEKDRKIGPPPKFVSPFYLEGPHVDYTRIRPGSQMHEAIQAAGGQRGGQRSLYSDPTRLPGIAERDIYNPPSAKL